MFLPFRCGRFEFSSLRQGLYLANTLQIYPEDRGTNYSVRLGKTIGQLVAEDLRQSAEPQQAEGSSAQPWSPELAQGYGPPTAAEGSVG